MQTPPRTPSLTHVLSHSWAGSVSQPARLWTSPTTDYTSTPSPTTLTSSRKPSFSGLGDDLAPVLVYPFADACKTSSLWRNVVRVLAIFVLLPLAWEALYPVVCLAQALVPASAPASLPDPCPRHAYDNGSWQRKSGYLRSIESWDDMYASFGVVGCAAGFQPAWNLGVEGRNPPFPDRVDVMSHAWQPHPTCRLREPDMLTKLQALIDGGLLLVGDSRARQHFYALSCELSEHVVWIGSHSGSDNNADADQGAWRTDFQHLHLNPGSPFLPYLHLPADFDLAPTPLISFAMAYLPLSRDEMATFAATNASWARLDVVSAAVQPYALRANRTLLPFADPASRYRTMLFSTGAHFSATAGFPGTTPAMLLGLERMALRSYLPALAEQLRPGQRVLVRAAAPGQTACWEHSGPTSEVLPPGDAYNYRFMADLNDVLQSEVELLGDARFAWIGMERQGRMRPDAHLGADCLHIAVGSGVIESWSRYMWHHLVA